MEQLCSTPVILMPNSTLIRSNLSRASTTSSAFLSVACACTNEVNERYNLMVHAPEYKEKLFGTAGGR